MNSIKRRDFLRMAGGAGLALAALPSLSVKAASRGRVVVVGGGFGGATCAKYLNRFDPDLSITLVEPAKQYNTCPFGNAVLGGLRDMDSITHSYNAHKKRGIKVVQARVLQVDATAKKVTLDNGKQLDYDRLVLSPGIDFKWDRVEGLNASDATTFPHAWRGGAQTTLLRQQLRSMADGGVVIVAPPDNPFRCPPGPYERVSLIAHYLKQHKPKSKILVLDAKESFSKQGLFVQAWQQLYPGMIEWVAGSKGGRIDFVDVKQRALHTETGDKHQGAVINLIPPQKAGEIVHTAGLTNNDGWCPVNQRSFESSVHAGIHVIGDASIAGKMPKSGFAANSQGKVCAAAIVSALHGLDMPEPSYVNTCYSLVSPDHGISVAAVYRYSKEQGIYPVADAGGVSPADADAAFRKNEARYAVGWYDSITADAFG
ncbi:MAG: NAD(P)/FAD-dependent oxidoreductase [Gammaproteobacteria bacterium]